MQKSTAYYHRELRGIALVCILSSLLGCTPKQEAPSGSLRADFNVAAMRDGRTVVWWLRMSGPDFTAMVHHSAGKPQSGGLDALVHRNVEAMIVEGLIQHGLIPCDPNYRTIAVMRDGSVQFTGTCTPGADVNVSSRGSSL
jgi:hypothetical protein